MIVFRYNVFNDDHLQRMEEITRAACADFECELVEFNAEGDHVHLLVNLPPKAAVTKLVNSLKWRLLPPPAPGGGTSLPKAGGEFP